MSSRLLLLVGKRMEKHGQLKVQILVQLEEVLDQAQHPQAVLVVHLAPASLNAQETLHLPSKPALVYVPKSANPNQRKKPLLKKSDKGRFLRIKFNKKLMP